MQEQTGNYDFFQYKSSTYERIWEHWSLLKYMDEDTFVIWQSSVCTADLNMFVNVKISHSNIYIYCGCSNFDQLWYKVLVLHYIRVKNEAE